jgi:FdhD protein
MGRITVRRRVVRHEVGAPTVRAEDTLVVEEPLDIRVNGKPLTVTMRTPGNDVELAIGFLLAEGIIASGEDVFSGEFCPGATDGGLNTYNVLNMTLAPGVAAPAPGLARNFITASSCGVCGKSSIDAVRTSSRFAVADDPLRLTSEAVAQLPARLRAEQTVFDRTGGLHAAGLVDGSTGRLLAVREDVGRHNAVDKVIGWAASHRGLPLSGTGLVVSSRASFELVQKAYMAGIPALVAVSAPSSLAVEFAVETGMTLIGFVRDSSMVVYSGAHRVTA